MSIGSTRHSGAERIQVVGEVGGTKWEGFTPDTWIPEERTPCYGNDDFTSDDVRVMREAAKLCSDCPARFSCLMQAVEMGARNTYGVWGGKVYQGGGAALGVCRECGEEFKKTRTLRLYCKKHYIPASNSAAYNRRDARLSGRKVAKTPTVLTDEQKQAVRDEYEEGVPYLHGNGTDHQSKRTRSNAKELMAKYNISRVYLRRVLRGQ